MTVLGRAALGVGMASCLACNGCTLLGLGVGSMVPRYEPMRASRVDEVPVGTQVQIKMEDGSRFTGKVESQPDPLIMRDLDTGRTRKVDPAKVWVAEKQVGSEWATGLFIGGVVDVVVVITAFVVVASQFHLSGGVSGI